MSSIIPVIIVSCMVILSICASVIGLGVYYNSEDSTLAPLATYFPVTASTTTIAPTTTTPPVTTPRPIVSLPGANTFDPKDNGWADEFPRGTYDLVGTGQKTHYCRNVGDRPNIFVSCGTAEKPYEYVSSGMKQGIDQKMMKVNGRDTFCRSLDDPSVADPDITCLGFNADGNQWLEANSVTVGKKSQFYV